jgi:hypothetical protein
VRNQLHLATRVSEILDGPERTKHSWIAKRLEHWAMKLGGQVDLTGAAVAKPKPNDKVADVPRLEDVIGASRSLQRFDADGCNVCWAARRSPASLPRFFQGVLIGQHDTHLSHDSIGSGQRITH